VTELVYVLVSTQKSVEWGKLVDILQTRVVGDCIFKSMWVRIPPQQQNGQMAESIGVGPQDPLR
jgi:hypothetical protein